MKVKKIIETILTFGLSNYMNNSKCSDGCIMVSNDILKNKKVIYTKL